ncbi:Leucine-rich repeat and WD repeat-containing protein 1 [Larimichthys crocea]|uniref:Uncharacterized protein n=1 Tax=Larimichthys crocea TaxID=215358 RepID=A0ACD3R3B6_LARCR|nr:Leucine-rich repeat and WD repeat-containing protein 1 [Larimichthys crocea]
MTTWIVNTRTGLHPVSLEHWDLSGNRLQEFPKNLELPALRYLDLSDNQIEDVTTLKSLSGLEELKLEDNLYITVSDNYKLMVLLPNLRMYNGKDVSTTANHLRYVYTENLRTRPKNDVDCVFENNCSLGEKLQSPGSHHSTENVHIGGRFCQHLPVNRLNLDRVRSATSLNGKVAIMAKEYFCSLTEPKEEPESKEATDTKLNCDVRSPTKRKPPMDSSISLTPLKILRTDPPAAEDSPRKSSLRLKPLIQDR